MLAPLPSKPMDRGAPGTQTITETQMSDGSKKITKSVVNADGSMTVTEEVVPAPGVMAVTGTEC